MALECCMHVVSITRVGVAGRSAPYWQTMSDCMWLGNGTLLGSCLMFPHASQHNSVTLGAEEWLLVPFMSNCVGGAALEEK